MKSMFRKGSDYQDEEDTGTGYGYDGEKCGEVKCKVNRYLPSLSLKGLGHDKEIKNFEKNVKF
jgi:hypothetical protein